MSSVENEKKPPISNGANAAAEEVGHGPGFSRIRKRLGAAAGG